MRRFLVIAGVALVAAGCQTPDAQVECAKLAAETRAVIRNDRTPLPRTIPYDPLKAREQSRSDGHLDLALRVLADPYARRLGVRDPYAFCWELTGKYPLIGVTDPYR